MQIEVLLVILGMAAVTMLSRVLPFYLLGNVQLSPLAAAWMRYLPIAILSAVVFPQLLLPPADAANTSIAHLPLVAALPTALVGFFTRNLLVSIFIGVGSLALLRTTF